MLEVMRGGLKWLVTLVIFSMITGKPDSVRAIILVTCLVGWLHWLVPAVVSKIVAGWAPMSPAEALRNKHPWR